MLNGCFAAAAATLLFLFCGGAGCRRFFLLLLPLHGVFFLLLPQMRFACALKPIE
jgi:hypothetical protein